MNDPRAHNARVAMLAIAALLAAVLLVASGVRVIPSPEDLRAFYCAGAAVDAGRNPYLAEPLRTCEVRATRAAGLAPYAELAIPAPLPAYDFAPFALLARIDFTRASTLFFLLQIAAFVASASLLTATTRRSPSLVFASLALSVGTLSAQSGQLFPFVLLGLCASARALQRAAYVPAAVFLGCTAIEPHLALPSLVALFGFVPQARATLVASAAVLAAVSVALVGFSADVAYVRDVLPAHALSELASTRQYSLATILAHAGIPAARALALANAQYALTCTAGIAIGRRCASRFAAPELLVLIPAAFAAFGGPFVHVTQVAIAIPAALALVNRQPRHHAVFAGAVLLLAIPWSDVAADPAPLGILLAALVAGTISHALWRPHSAAIAAIAACAGLLEFGERTATLHYAPPSGAPDAAIARVASGNRLAEDTWGAFEKATVTNDTPGTLAVRLPTWLGLAFIAGASVAAARDGRARPAKPPSPMAETAYE